jgi:cytoskeletal protein RodZ
MRRFTISAALLLVLAACGSDVPTGPSTSLRATGASASESASDTLPPPPPPPSDTTSEGTSETTSTQSPGGIMMGSGT